MGGVLMLTKMTIDGLPHKMEFNHDTYSTEPVHISHSDGLIYIGTGTWRLTAEYYGIPTDPNNSANRYDVYFASPTDIRKKFMFRMHPEDTVRIWQDEKTGDVWVSDKEYDTRVYCAENVKISRKAVWNEPQ